MDDLVSRLSEKWSPVEVTLRPDKTVEAFRNSLDLGYVHIKFTETRGGTELGVPVDRQLSDVSAADFENATGMLRIVGDLTLDFVKVRCTAKIQLPSMQGQGRLEPLQEESVGALSNPAS